MAKDGDKSTSLTIDWDNDHAVRGFAEAALELKETHNREIERQAELNIAWTCGRQLLFWSSNSGRLVLQSNPENRVRVVMNVTRPVVEAVVAKLGSLPTWLKSRRATTDLSDYDMSLYQTQVLAHYQRALDFVAKAEKWDRQTVVCAEAYAKVYWNPKAGRAYGDFGPEDLGVTPEEFKKQHGDKTKSGIHEGDVCADVVSLFNLFWGPPDSEFEQKEWLIETYDRSRAYVQEQYEIPAAELNAAFESHARTWRPSTGGAFGSRMRTATKDQVRVVEIWVKPMASIPGLERGRHVVVCGEHVPVNGPNPYEHQEIPFSRFPLLEVPTENRGETFVTDVLPLQRDINQATGQATENREIQANPPWLVHENSIVDDREWDNRVGGRRTYRGPQAPRLEKTDTNYRSAASAIEIDLHAIEELAGVRQVSQGRNPPGVRSGAAVSLLQQADDARLGPVARSRSDFLRRTGSLILATFSQYATEERLIRITGDESGRRTRLLSGDMLRARGRPATLDNFDTILDPDAPPRSRSALRQDLTVLMDRQFLTPSNPDHAAFVFDTLQLGMPRRERNRKRRARELQHERNLAMARGKYESPDQAEDLETMMEEMRDFQHDPVYATLPGKRKKLFVQYEEEVLATMALRKVYREAVVKAALARVGIDTSGPPGAAGAPAPAGAESAEAFAPALAAPA